MTRLKKDIRSTKTTPRKRFLNLQEACDSSWSKIPTVWPLENIIAANPLQGFEHLPFEEGMKEASKLFQRDSLPERMIHINRETIKWVQVLSDKKHARIHPFSKTDNAYEQWLSFIQEDPNLHSNDSHKKQWMESIPLNPSEALEYCLSYLNIPSAKVELFLTLMLTTLPGWSGHIKHQDEREKNTPASLNKDAYLTIRLIIVSLLWPDAANLFDWYEEDADHEKSELMLSSIKEAEKRHHQTLWEKFSLKQTKVPLSEAQLVFCIDVRSEGLRRAIEASGPYETFGFAGFFAMPIAIDNHLTEKHYNSCPVLFDPVHHVTIDKDPNHSCTSVNQKKRWRKRLKRAYATLQYNFATPFVLVETLGIFSGLWMFLKNFFPSFIKGLKNQVTHSMEDLRLEAAIQSIPESDQLDYARGMLSAIGLKNNFAPLVVLCGHGSSNENNAFASALECGACGAHAGNINAMLMAFILNKDSIRKGLEKDGIRIPQKTQFVGGLHDTTTDKITLYANGVSPTRIQTLQRDLDQAQKLSTKTRIKTLAGASKKSSVNHVVQRSMDWSQILPEWGLSRNAAFIIGERSLTQGASLKGRAFLHSYDWKGDDQGSILENIMAGPMVVGQWINNQYLFSTLDNVAFGAGSKITKNITGKFGIMQGNASDLMYGLPLQSLYKDDSSPYHEPVRLVVIIQSPKDRITKILEKADSLKALFTNQWIFLRCIDPEDGKIYTLESNLTWSPH